MARTTHLTSNYAGAHSDGEVESEVRKKEFVVEHHCCRQEDPDRHDRGVDESIEKE